LFRSSDSLFDNWDAVIFFFFFNMFLTSNMELACHNFSDKILDFIFLYVASYILFPVLTYPFFFVAAELISRSLWCFIGLIFGTDCEFATYVDQIEYVHVCNIELVLPKLLDIVKRRLSDLSNTPCPMCNNQSKGTYTITGL